MLTKNISIINKNSFWKILRIDKQEHLSESKINYVVTDFMCNPRIFTFVTAVTYKCSFPTDVFPYISKVETSEIREVAIKFMFYEKNHSYCVQQNKTNIYYNRYP